jgi:hypothetical protein
MNWIIDNKEWFFSGLGTAILMWVLAALFSGKSKNKQIQKSGKNSTNI